MVALDIADRCVAAGFPYYGLEFRDLNDNLLADIHGISLATKRVEFEGRACELIIGSA